MRRLAALAVPGDGPGQLLAELAEGLQKDGVAVILPLDEGIARSAVGQHRAHIVGGGVPVHRHPVEGAGDHLVEGLGEHLPGDGAVGGDEAQHGAHVGMDHAGALGDGAECHGPAADRAGEGKLLLHRVGGHDGAGRRVGAFRPGGEARRRLRHPRPNGGDVEGLADDAGGGHHEVGGCAAGGPGGQPGHLLGVLVAMGQQALALPLLAATPQAVPSSRCSTVT